MVSIGAMSGPGQQTRPVRALVLGGGGAHGFAQAVYIHAAIELGFRPDLVIGTSVGALNGAWIAMHPDKPQGLIEIWRDLGELKLLRWSPARLAALVARHRAISQNDVVERLIQEHIRELRFADMAVPLAVIATNLTTAAKAVFRDGALAPAIRASTAVPGVYAPVEIDGHLYVDGCLTATVDLATAIDGGATEILAIALGRPREEAAPRTLLGVLRRSLEVMSHATTVAMMEAAPRSAKVQVVRPNLANESAWRLRNTTAAERRFRQEAFLALEPLIDAHGRLTQPPLSIEGAGPDLTEHRRAA